MIVLSRPLIGPEEMEAVGRVLKSGWLASGPETQAFEAEFARYTGTPHAVALSSGTAALHLGILALGIGPDHEVVVPSFSFVATANAVRLVGATPVFAEVDPRTFCVASDTVSAVLTKKTVAVVCVHLYGQPAPMDELVGLTDSKGLALIEDAAQAHGASWAGRQVGTWGVFGAFSFYPTKNMTTGEGGMITTSDESLVRRVRMLRNQGMEQRYRHEIVGMNQRMTEIASAMGRIQLQHLPEWNVNRRKNAAGYDAALAGYVSVPFVAEPALHVYHQYTVAVENRPRLVESLESNDVGHGIYYDPPIHLQGPYRDAGDTMPITESLSRQVVSIPVRPDLTQAERDKVVDAVIASAGA